MYEDEVEEYLKATAEEHQESIFFVQHNLGAEVHWFFHQATIALRSELYIPACTSFLIGIEASLRFTLSQIENQSTSTELDPQKILSNKLLNSAKAKGMPVELLAFPSEIDFHNKLNSVKPNVTNVEVVRVRHNMCHGNITEYLNHDLGPNSVFFTPECLSELTHTLHFISKQWVVGLGEFRKNKLNV